MGPLKGGGLARLSGVMADELGEAVSGTRGQTTSQSDPGPVLHGEMLYLLVLPYSHDSAPTSEPARLLTWGKRPRLTTPQLKLHLSWESLYYPPRAVNHAVEDTIRQFHQAHFKAAGSESDRQPAADIRGKKKKKSIEHGTNDLTMWCN